MGEGTGYERTLPLGDEWMAEFGAAQGGHSVLGCWDSSEEGLCEPEGLFHDTIEDGWSRIPNGKFNMSIDFSQNLCVGCEVSPL